MKYFVLIIRYLDLLLYPLNIVFDTVIYVVLIELKRIGFISD